jgi:hypothetical protein
VGWHAGCRVSDESEETSMNRRTFGLVMAAFGVIAVAAALGVWSFQRYWPQRLIPAPYRGLPVTSAENGRIAIQIRGSRPAGEIARFDDELLAYLMFDYLRGQPGLGRNRLFLTYSAQGGVVTYRILMTLPNDVAAGPPEVFEFARQFPFLTPRFLVLDERVWRDMVSQSRSFELAYHFPKYRDLEGLSREEVVAYARRFIRFKSVTDPRVLRQIEPAPRALSREEAGQLAEDIVTVANFYSLPLDFFLGIGAMENNYMNVDGDLGHAVWKRRAEKGDVVLRRKGRRVLVLDEASGVWQITRETLRYAHKLYLHDTRDYSALPEPLRPPQQMDDVSLQPRVLTTYAGLLFRDLLDHFDGDIAKAVGAYNGGRRSPNPVYEAGVSLVANYARRVMEQAAALRGQRVDEMQFLDAASGGNPVAK